MRRFMQGEVVWKATALGALLTLFSLPYLYSQSQHAPFGLLAALLFPITVLLLQAALAWSRMAPAPAWLVAVSDRNAWLLLVVGAAILSLGQYAAFDDTMRVAHPDFFPRDRREWLEMLPWVVTVQPLITVAGIYAFAARFFRRFAVCAVALVVVRVLLFMSWRSLVPLPFFLMLEGAAVVCAGFLALTYSRLGLPGIWAATIVMQIRFVIELFGR